MKIFAISIVLVMMLAACNATEKVNIEDTLLPESEMESAAAEFDGHEVANPLKNIKLPKRPAEWQKAYADYLSGSFFSEHYQPELFSVYIEDINKDGIPEIFLYSWVDWAYPQIVLTYAGGKAVETSFNYYTSVPGCCFLYLVPESGQLVVKQTGHTTGTAGMLHYSIYDDTSDGYVLSHDLNGAEDWAIEEYGVHSFRCSINGETVEYYEFVKAVDERIKPLNMIDVANQEKIFIEDVPEIIFSEDFLS